MRQMILPGSQGAKYHRVAALPVLSRVALLTALLSFSLVGCGGGGGGGGSSTTPSPSPTPIPSASPTPAAKRAVPQITIQWGARSRATGAPSSALSVVVTLTGAADGGGDVQFTANRDASVLAAYTQTYTFPAAVVENRYPMTVRCYGQASGVSPLVAQGSTTFILADGGTLPDISLNNTVARVAIADGQSVLVGQSADLIVTAYDSVNDVVLVTPGSIFLALSAGAANLAGASSGGATVQALHPGTATVAATIDGIVSPAATVNVTSNTVVSISPVTPPTLNVSDPLKFVATVTNAPDTSVTWSVAEGAAGGTVDQTGLYTAPTTTGTYHIIATSNYDPAHQATVAVTVANGSVTVGGSFPGSGGVGATIN